MPSNAFDNHRRFIIFHLRKVVDDLQGDFQNDNLGML